MRVSSLFRHSGRIGYGVTALLALIISGVLPLVAPYLTDTAYADRPISKADMLIGGLYNKDNDDKYRNPTNAHWEMMSCMGSVTRMALNDDLIKRALRVSNFTGWSSGDRSDAYDTLFDGMQIGKSGPLTDNQQRDYYEYIKANHNQDVPVLSWHKSASPTPGSTASCGSDDPQGGHFILIPVHSRDGSRKANNADTWIACQMWTREDADSTKNRTSGCNATRYTATAGNSLQNPNTSIGTAEFFKTAIASNNGLAFAEGVSVNDFVVRGFAKPAGTVASGNISYGEFVDAATIKITGKLDGHTITETYVDPAWDGRHIYFLESTEGVEVRKQLTYSQKGGSQRDDPIRDPTTRRGVPFIYIGGQAPNIDFEGGQTMAKFGNGIHSPIANSIQYYDYQPSGAIVCNGPCPGNGLPSPVELSTKLTKMRAKVWFYYNANDEAMVSVFGRGDSNERNYIGTYAYDKELKRFTLPGPGCKQIGSVALDPGVAALVDASWYLRPPNTNCVATAGWANPVRVQVSSDPAGYNKAMALQAETAAQLSPDAEAGKVTCDASISSPLTWIMCPIASAATSATDALDSIINQILTVNANRYFGDKDPGPKLYAVYNSLRIIAMAIIVIVALVMVIAQASGWETISPLAIRKGLPDVVFTVILLGLWWPIGKALITAADVATYGVRNLIYGPFGDIAVFQLDGTAGTGGTTAVMALLTSGYLLALGVFASATIAVSAFVAAAIGAGILMLRIGIIIAFQTIMSLFIAFRPIPNMKGVWSFGWGTFSKALYLGPAIAGAIAFSRVLAGIFYTISGAAGTTDLNNAPDTTMRYAFIVMAILLYFGVYAFIMQIVTAMGGLAATLAGRFNDRSRGIFDRLKNARAKAPGDRWKKFKHGELHQDGMLFNQRGNNAFSKFSRFTGRMGERAGLGAKNNFGYGDRGRAAMALHEESQLDDIIRNNGTLRALGLNDDQANAVLALSGGTLSGAKDAIADLRKGGQSINAAQEKQILSTIMPLLGDRKNAAAAARTMMQNKARGVALGDVDSIDRGMNRLGEDNPYMAQMYKSSVAYFARSSGRADLGGEWNSGKVQNYMATLQASATAKGKPISDAEARGYGTMLDGVGRTDLGALLRGHPSQVNQLNKTIKFILDNVDEGTPEGLALRTEAVTRALELQKGLSSGQASADVQQSINGLMNDLGVNMSDPNKYGSVADQLAKKATKSRTLLNGSKLSAQARVYDNDQPLDARYGGSLPDGK